jgi:hypothetical protein
VLPGRLVLLRLLLLLLLRQSTTGRELYWRAKLRRSWPAGHASHGLLPREWPPTVATA